jgi:pimeloyl-ACP methyl ester carboxylesterase
MATIGLVHGAGHGAWCWARLEPELRARGHRTVAMDLPCEEPAAGASRYAAVVDRALPPADDLVLVGHSLGGLTIPLVATLRPVRHLVFLCALIPVPGQSLADQVAADPGIYAGTLAGHPGRVTEVDGTTWFRDEAAARDVFYHDCTPGDVHWAFARLRRQAAAPRREPCPLARWPAVTASYVLASDDRAIAPAWSRRAAPARLGVTPVELAGSHSPFLARPVELAAVLDELCRR